MRTDHNIQNHLFSAGRQEPDSPTGWGEPSPPYQSRVAMVGGNYGGGQPQAPSFQSWPAQSPPSQLSVQPPSQFSSPGGGLDFYSGGDMSEMEPMPPAPVLGQRSETMTGMFDSAAFGVEDYANEPPLLEELDINFDHIKGKTMSVLLPFRKATPGGDGDDDALILDSDLTGPIFFLICLGGSLLLQGKLSFGYIYGFGVFGCTALYTLLNLLSPPQSSPIDFWQVTSTLGYCLLPVVVLAVVGIVVSLTGLFGNCLAAVAIAWCTYTATRIFERSLAMSKQRFLIAYPTGLLYACFVLITIF